MYKWKVTFKINSYFYYNESFQINGIEFFRQNKNDFAAVYVEDLKDEDKAKKDAVNKLEKVIDSTKFILDQNIDYQLKNIIQINGDGKENQGLNLFPSTVTVVKEFPKNKIENIKKLSDKIGSFNKKKKAVLKYYLRGRRIEGWNDESFLNYYKAIELISATYCEEGKKKIEKENFQKKKELINRLKESLNNDNSKKYSKIIKKIYKLGFVASERKIELAINDLNLKIKNYRIENIVKIRNKIAAHGRSEAYIKCGDVKMCKKLAKDMICNYITD